MRAIYVFIFIFLSAPAFADELRIYGFTSSFVECVKKYSQESAGTPPSNGIAHSALMNGNSVINGPDLDGQYWGYMDCITPSDSGVDNEALETVQSCPEISINLGDRNLYVPPSVEGKIFEFGGAKWTCVTGKWERDSLFPEIIEKYDGCESVTFEHNSCSFILPDKQHGASFWAKNTANPMFSGDHYYGKGLFVCSNGQWKASSGSLTCEPSVCQSDQTMHWNGSGMSQCSGKIASDGSVVQIESEPRFFSTLDDALLKTKSMVGSAEYVCTQYGWEIKSSSCEQKMPASLTCASRTTSIGTKEYSCK